MYVETKFLQINLAENFVSRENESDHPRYYWMTFRVAPLLIMYRVLSLMITMHPMDGLPLLQSPP